jgi:hypothetical protein
MKAEKGASTFKPQVEEKAIAPRPPVKSTGSSFKGTPEMVELERAIQGEVSRAQSRGMDEDSIREVLLNFADSWVTAFRSSSMNEKPPTAAANGDVKQHEEVKELSSKKKLSLLVSDCPLSGSFWWLPEDLPRAVVKQIIYDTDVSFTVEGNASMFRIVLSTTLFIVLVPCVVFGAWFAGFVYQQHGANENLQYVRLVYRHFFGIFSDWVVRMPSLYEFNLTVIVNWRDALVNMPNFGSVPPIEMVDGSKVFAALSFTSAIAKVIASGVGAFFAAIRLVQKNKIIGAVAKENASMEAIFENHPVKTSHAALVQRLEQFGLKKLHYKLAEEEEGTACRHFLEFENHTHVLAIPLSVFARKDFAGLVVLNVAHCPLVTGSLEPLTVCVSLEKLNLWNCPQISGPLSTKTLAWLSALKSKALYGCGSFTFTADLGEQRQEGGLASLTTAGLLQGNLCLETMDSLSGSLESLSKSAPALVNVNLQSCVFLRDPSHFFSQGFVMAKVNVSGNPWLLTLDVFKPLGALVELQASLCPKLKGTLAGLCGTCTKLIVLDVAHCKRLSGPLTHLLLGEGEKVEEEEKELSCSLAVLNLQGSDGLTGVCEFTDRFPTCTVKMNNSRDPFFPLKSALGTILVTVEKKCDPPLKVSTAKLANQRSSLKGQTNPAAQWRLTREGLLENAATGLVLQVEGHHDQYKTDVTLNIRSSDLAAAPWQLWKITKNGELESALKPGLVLTIRNGSHWEHAQVWVHKRNGTAAQNWSFLSEDSEEAPSQGMKAPVLSSQPDFEVDYSTEMSL